MVRPRDKAIGSFREWNSHDGKGSFGCLFPIGSLTRQDILCQNTSNMPRGCRSCGVQRPKWSGGADPTLVPAFTVPPLQHPPRTTHPGGFNQLFVKSFMSAKQPNRKPTGKRKESDASAQEGRERKRAASLQGPEGGLPPTGPSRRAKSGSKQARIHASALASHRPDCRREGSKPVRPSLKEKKVVMTPGRSWRPSKTMIA